MEAKADIRESRNLVNSLMKDGFIKQPPPELIEKAAKIAIDSVS
jgi:hypothetical protein